MKLHLASLLLASTTSIATAATLGSPKNPGTSQYLISSAVSTFQLQKFASESKMSKLLTASKINR